MKSASNPSNCKGKIAALFPTFPQTTWLWILSTRGQIVISKSDPTIDLIHSFTGEVENEEIQELQLVDVDVCRQLNERNTISREENIFSEPAAGPPI
jgi:hypothetical protein